MDKGLEEGQLLEPNLPSTSTQNNDLKRRFPTYQKLGGATDLGRQYEQIMCGHYALNLVTNDEVNDFEMTSNNLTDGKFDDIGLSVTFQNGKSTQFLFQLKHKENKSINPADFISESKNSDFGVKKYLKSLKEMNVDKNTVCILYTNCSTKIKGKMSLIDGISFEPCNHIEFGEFLVNTRRGCDNAIFEVKSKSLEEKFYLFTSQLNVQTTEEQINSKLRNLLQCDIHDAFTTYMRNWWSGKFILTKHDIISKLSQLAFSPYLKTLTDDKCNEKTESLKETIMKFPVTIVENCDEDIVRNIWKIEDSWIDKEFRTAKNKYRLKEHQTDTILWHLGKVPLVVRVDRSNGQVIGSVLNLLRKDTQDKRVILMGTVSKMDFGQWDPLVSSWDVVQSREGNRYYSDIMQNFHISFQGRGSITLEHLIKADADVAKLIGIRELLRMSQQEHLLVGNLKQDLPDLLIPRCISPNLLSCCIKKNRDRLYDLIELAIKGWESDDAPTTKGNVEAARILIKNGAPLYATLDTACDLKRFNMLEILIENGAKLNQNDQKTILHILVQDCPGKYHEELANAIKKFHLCVNAKDSIGATALHRAAESAESKILEVLIENGADLNATDAKGRSVLHYATKRFRAGIIKLLLDRGSTVDARNNKGKTALHLASEGGRGDIVEMLLDNGADPKLVDNQKENALHYASRSTNDTPDVILILISKGLDVNQRNQDGVTPLHLACEEGNLKTVAVLLQQGADPNLVDKKGENALHHAVDFSFKTSLELLKEKGVDVNARNHEGSSVLHKAAASANLETVETLERNGADPNTLDYNGRSILHYASTNSRKDVLESFLNRGLCVDAPDINGVVPLHLALERGDDEISELLLQRGANPKLVDNQGNNSLHYASKSKYGTGDVIELLICEGLDVNAKNKDGYEPIHFVRRLGNLCALLRTGAQEDVNAKLENGETLLHLVCKMKGSYLPIELQEKGADPNSVDNYRRNALHYHLLESYDKELVYQMIDRGLNLYTLYENGQTLLHVACLHGDVRNVRELVGKGVDVNVLDDNGLSPLQVIIQSLKRVSRGLFDDLYTFDNFTGHEHESEGYEFGCEGCYSELLADLMLSTRDTSFVAYVKREFFNNMGRKKKIDSFLHHVLTVNFETDFESTMVCIVARLIVFETVTYLLENGAVVNIADNFNKTATDYASELEEQFPEITSLLRKHHRSQRRSSFLNFFRFNCGP